LPRKKEIEAAIAAYNATDSAMLLPPDASRLLSVMFRPRLLRALAEAGFLSKEQAQGRDPNTYHLHLPPVRP
jgi:hypothetical protein